MTHTPAPITADATIAQWLEHPTGGPALSELLTRAGRDPGSLAPAKRVPLARLVELGGGLISAEDVRALVLRANGGVVPEPGDGPSADRWTERVVAGRFEGRTVVVTGAASGIGRATALRVAREGGRVIAVDLTVDGLTSLLDEAGSWALEAVATDITDAAGIDRVVQIAGPRIDGLANVAGVTDDLTPLHEVSDAMWRRNFAVNVDGTFLLSRAVLPSMLAAGRGSIVNVASEAALRGSAAGIAYTASKHAVVGMTKSAAFMYGPSGVRVNAVAPGPTMTAMRPSVGSELGRERIDLAKALLPEIAEPAQLAASITFLLSDDATNISGAILPSDGGWSAA